MTATDEPDNPETSDEPETAPSGEPIRRWIALGLVFMGGLGVAAWWLAPEGSTSDATKSETRVDADPVEEGAPTGRPGVPDRLPAPPEPSPSTSDPEDLDLTGTWVHRSVQTSLTDIPVGGEVTSRTITYRVTEVRQQGDRVDLTATVCDTNIESNSNSVTTIIPEAFIDSIPVAERQGTLTTDEGVPTLEVERTCGVRGADVENPTAAELPTSPDDERVVDGDGDGHPGVTIRLKGTISGKIYLAQRGCDSFEGRVISEDHIRGTVDWNTDKELLGSNSMFLKSNPPSKPHSDPERSWFEMRRVEGGVTCEDVLDDPESFFE